MKNLALRLSFALFISFVVSGCELIFPPATSATLSRYESGKPIRQRDLSDRQLHQLTDWFSAHQSGWSPTYVTYAPAVYLQVIHTGGKHSTINILAPTHVVINYDGKQIEQEFTPTVIRDLVSIAETGND